MTLKSVLTSIDVAPEANVEKELAQKTKEMLRVLQESARKEKLNVEFFVGGSFAKKTLVKKDLYDIDIFVRFDWRLEDLTSLLLKILERAVGTTKEVIRLHGSRDYFQIKEGNVIFEIIPVLKIKKVQEARNVTDLSYFHVNYVLKNLRKNKRLAREIALAKTFCRAQGVYGAESYIQGFSGYALECLIINYKTLDKMLDSLSKVETQLVLDPAKHFKKNRDALFKLNESKLTSPVVLIDPTWSERNVLAAVSTETFEKFKKAARAFLKKPSASFFIPKAFSVEDMKKESVKQKAELVEVTVSTDRQVGDIAGTKLKKFSRFLLTEIGTLFVIKKTEFIYNEADSAQIYISAQAKKSLERIGPPVKMEKAAKAFKKVHPNAFVRAGTLHVTLPVEKSLHTFLDKFIKERKKILDDMDLRDIAVRKL